MSALALVALLGLQGGCSSDRTNLADQGFFDPDTAPPATGDSEHPPSDIPHGDHTPHKGGTVMMYGDLHYEVLLERSGSYALYLSNELREELPASDVEDVSFTIRVPDRAEELVTLEPDAEDTGWFGTGEPVDNAQTVARIAFTYLDKPYWIDLMFPQAQFQPEGDVPDALRAPDESTDTPPAP